MTANTLPHRYVGSKINRLHQMHEMQTIATDVSVCQSVCLSRGVTRLRCAETAERIEVRFGMKIFEGPRNIVLNGSLDPQRRGRGESAHSMQPLPNYFGLLLNIL